MTPNIAERVDTPEYNQMRLNEIKRGICDCGYCTNIDQDKRFLLSLIDKYQKLVERIDESVQMYGNLLVTQEIKKAEIESGLFDSKTVGEG